MEDPLHREDSWDDFQDAGQTKIAYMKAQTSSLPIVATTSSGQMPSRRLFSGKPVDDDCGCEDSPSTDDIQQYPFGRLENKTEGKINLQIQKLSSMGEKDKASTGFHHIANLPWRLSAKWECRRRTSFVKFFSVYIDCNPESESTLWSCDAIVEFQLLPQKPDSVPTFTRQFTNKFCYNSNNWGFPSFIEWNDVLNTEKGYIKADQIEIEARITVVKVTGVRPTIHFDFFNSQPHTCDAVLIIEGQKLHVNKTYLALYSPVFHAMFYSKFVEKEKKEINVVEVIHNEFVEFLEVIYPSHKPVTAENVDFLLELGDKFEVQYVINECEKFLINTEDFPVCTKLVWADQYSLAKLQDVCLRTFKSMNEIKALKRKEEYKNYSDKTKAALLEKLFKMMKD